VDEGQSTKPVPQPKGQTVPDRVQAGDDPGDRTSL